MKLAEAFSNGETRSLLADDRQAHADKLQECTLLFHSSARRHLQVDVCQLTEPPAVPGKAWRPSILLQLCSAREHPVLTRLINNGYSKRQLHHLLLMACEKKSMVAPSTAPAASCTRDYCPGAARARLIKNLAGEPLCPHVERK